MEQITIQLPVGKASPQRILGLKIKMYRLYRGFSLKELEAKAGLSVTSLSRIESGQQDIPFLDLNQISIVLDVPISSFSPGK